jgi:hypothetical protein
MAQEARVPRAGTSVRTAAAPLVTVSIAQAGAAPQPLSVAAVDSGAFNATWVVAGGTPPQCAAVSPAPMFACVGPPPPPALERLDALLP